MSDKTLLGSITRTPTEELQISINEYKGKKYLDLRIFFTTDGGASWKPTQKGVTVAPDKLDVLKEAIAAAEKEFETDV